MAATFQILTTLRETVHNCEPSTCVVSAMLSFYFMISERRTRRRQTLSARRIFHFEPLVVLADLGFSGWFQAGKLGAQWQPLDQCRIAYDGLFAERDSFSSCSHFDGATIIGCSRRCRCCLCRRSTAYLTYQAATKPSLFDVSFTFSHCRVTPTFGIAWFGGSMLASCSVGGMRRIQVSGAMTG